MACCAWCWDDLVCVCVFVVLVCFFASPCCMAKLLITSCTITAHQLSVGGVHHACLAAGAAVSLMHSATLTTLTNTTGCDRKQQSQLLLVCLEVSFGDLGPV